ncbi:MAG TPA: hypothetical protein VFR13_00305 [Jiangellaceae bacterium]|nr:hypothetical protein [Jiangellaceae bacterium]
MRSSAGTSLPGELTIAEAARKERVSEQSIGRPVEGGVQALGEAAVELRVWRKSAEGRLGHSRTST